MLRRNDPQLRARSEHFWLLLRRKPHLNNAFWVRGSFSQAFSRSTTQKGAVGAFPSESCSHLLRRRIPSHHAVSFGTGARSHFHCAPPQVTTQPACHPSQSPSSEKNNVQPSELEPPCDLRAKIPQPSYAYFLTSPKAPLDGKHPCPLLQSSHSVVAAEKMGVSDWEGASSSRGWESLSAPELSTFDRLRQSPASNMALSHLLLHSQ